MTSLEHELHSGKKASKGKTMLHTPKNAKYLVPKDFDYVVEHIRGLTIPSDIYSRGQGQITNKECGSFMRQGGKYGFEMLKHETMMWMYFFSTLGLTKSKADCVFVTNIRFVVIHDGWKKHDWFLCDIADVEHKVKDLSQDKITVTFKNGMQDKCHILYASIAEFLAKILIVCASDRMDYHDPPTLSSLRVRCPSCQKILAPPEGIKRFKCGNCKTLLKLKTTKTEETKNTTENPKENEDKKEDKKEGEATNTENKNDVPPENDTGAKEEVDLLSLDVLQDAVSNVETVNAASENNPAPLVNSLSSVNEGVNCTNCSEPIIKNHKFCGLCGTPAPVNIGHCPQCSAATVPGMKFCGSCGSVVDGSVVDPSKQKKKGQLLVGLGEGVEGSGGGQNVARESQPLTFPVHDPADPFAGMMVVDPKKHLEPHESHDDFVNLEATDPFEDPFQDFLQEGGSFATSTDSSSPATTEDPTATSTSPRKKGLSKDPFASFGQLLVNEKKTTQGASEEGQGMDAFKSLMMGEEGR